MRISFRRLCLLVISRKIVLVKFLRAMRFDFLRDVFLISIVQLMSFKSGTFTLSKIDGCYISKWDVGKISKKYNHPGNSIGVIFWICSQFMTHWIETNLSHITKHQTCTLHHCNEYAVTIFTAYSLGIVKDQYNFFHISFTGFSQS